MSWLDGYDPRWIRFLKEHIWVSDKDPGSITSPKFAMTDTLKNLVSEEDDRARICPILDRLLQEKPDATEGELVGAIMKALQGKVNPVHVRQCIHERKL